MPTGYTSALYDGEQAFDEFMLTMARGMGALITMRDAPLDAEVPDTIEADTNYDDRAIDEAEEDLRALDTMTVAEAGRRAQAAYEESMERKRREESKRKALRARYVEMLEKVQAWQPPTPDHKGLKEYAVSQLEESIRFDCGGMDYWPVKSLLSGEEWIASERERAWAELKRHRKQRKEAIERAEERTEWVRGLKGSLGGVHA